MVDQKFVCLFSARGWAKVVAGLTIVANIILTVWKIVSVVMLHVNAPANPCRSTAHMMKVKTAVGVATILVTTLSAIMGAVLIIGSRNEHGGKILVWLMYNAMSVIVTMGLYLALDQSAWLIVVVVIVLAAEGFFSYVVHEHWKQVKASKVQPSVRLM